MSKLLFNAKFNPLCPLFFSRQQETIISRILRKIAMILFNSESRLEVKREGKKKQIFLPSGCNLLCTFISAISLFSRGRFLLPKDCFLQSRSAYVFTRLSYDRQNISIVRILATNPTEEAYDHSFSLHMNHR